MTRALCVAALLSLACAPAWWGDGGQAIVRTPDSDGCTMSPDVVGAACCAAHDLAYRLGGTPHDRFAADAQLLACLAYEGVPERVALVYYRAVREFGASHWKLDLHSQP